MEHLGGIPLTEPRTLEVDVLMGPFHLVAFVEKMDDNTVKILPL